MTSLKMTWTLERTAEAAANATGVIGESSEDAMRVSARLGARDGCSRTGLRCKEDRNGVELCFGI